MLTADDFCVFFQEVHGYPPFPWQKRLLAQVAASGEWPDTLDLPTGSGKTAAIDIAIFHLALEIDLRAVRRAPVRIAFVVDRRLVVDDAFERARKLETALVARVGNVTARVAERLKALSGDGPPLIARRLRGGIPRDDDWARTPSQPTVLCSTVDQVGSRLLFRGYGMSDSMKPVHAGLIGSDCLILLDEAHLAEPFRQTLGWVERYRSEKWRKEKDAGPWGFARLSATPGERSEDVFSLDDDDRANPILRQRLEAEKPALLVAPIKSTTETAEAVEIDDTDDGRGRAKDLARRAAVVVGQCKQGLEHLKDDGSRGRRPAIGVVVNRIARAREVFTQLAKQLPHEPQGDAAEEAIPEVVLMIGPARPVDRDDLVEKKLKPIRTGEPRELGRPLVLVATQCIEAGVDIDLDALITEAAPIDSLRQRFGRLNRAGRDIKPYAAIIADKTDISAQADDPVYGKAIKLAWDYLVSVATKENGSSFVDFGIEKMNALTPPDQNALTEKSDAPILLPAHLDLLSETSPIPAADPNVALYLHGPTRQPDSITIVWRADIDPAWDDQDLIRLLMLVPPRSGEAIELPIWTVRRWLEGRRKSAADVADLPAREPNDKDRQNGKRVFRWKGDDAGSQWIGASELSPGDAVVVPASYGGVDEFGWNPEDKEAARDVAHKAAEPFARKTFAVRVAPGLLEESMSDEALAAKLAGLRAENAETVRLTLLDLQLPAQVRRGLEWLGNARRARVVVDFDLYGENDKDEPRGLVLWAPYGIEIDEEDDGAAATDEDGRPNSTEDDAAGLIFDRPLSLNDHTRDVESKAQEFVKRAGLPDARAADLELAASLHDLGKIDCRFQAWMHFGDPLGFDPDDIKDVLAKSGRPLPRAARRKAGLPDRWRHESLSVRLARLDSRLEHAADPDLVIWLVGSHHGYGRPLFPHRDPQEEAPNVGPQSLAFDWKGLDWPSLFVRLKARYGLWELARMEAILRLADHRASQEARNRAAKEIGE